MLEWLSVWSEVQPCIWPSWCHCHSLSLASVKSRLVLPFWYWLTWVVPDKGPLNVSSRLSSWNGGHGNYVLHVTRHYTLLLHEAHIKKTKYISYSYIHLHSIHHIYHHNNNDDTILVIPVTSIRLVIQKYYCMSYFVCRFKLISQQPFVTYISAIYQWQVLSGHIIAVQFTGRWSTQLAVSKSKKMKKQMNKIITYIKHKQNNSITFSLNCSWRGRQAKSTSNMLLLPAGLSSLCPSHNHTIGVMFRKNTESENILIY